MGSRNRATELHVAAGIQTERPLRTGTRQIQITLRVQIQIGGTDHTVARQSQVLRSTHGGSSLRPRGQIQQHLLRTGNLDEHITLCRFGHDAVGIDLEHRIGRAYAGVGLDIEQAQVHVDRHRCGRWHGQAAGRQTQGVQVEVQVGKARRLAQHQVDARDSQTAFFAHGLRGLQRQGTHTAPAHRIVLASKQAVEEAHRGVVGGHRERASLSGIVLLKAYALQELHLLRAGNHQLAAAAQHHLAREHHLAAGVDGHITIHIQPLAKGHIHGVADHQPFQAGQLKHLDSHGPGVPIGRRAGLQVAELRACHRQNVADLEATAHRDQAHSADAAVLDRDVGRCAATAATGQHHALVGEAAILIGHGRAGVSAEMASVLKQADARSGIANAVADPAIYRYAALVGRQIEHVARACAAIDAARHMEAAGLLRIRIAHGQRDRAIEADRVVDLCALAQAQLRAIGEHRGVARAKDAEGLALDAAGHRHLAARALRLDRQRHRDRQA